MGSVRDLRRATREDWRPSHVHAHAGKCGRRAFLGRSTPTVHSPSSQVHSQARWRRARYYRSRLELTACCTKGQQLGSVRGCSGLAVMAHTRHSSVWRLRKEDHGLVTQQELWKRKK